MSLIQVQLRLPEYNLYLTIKTRTAIIYYKIWVFITCLDWVRAAYSWLEIVKSYHRTVGTTGIACGEDVRLGSRKIDKLFSVKQEPRDFSRGRFR